MPLIQLGALLLGPGEPGWKGLMNTARQFSWMAFIRRVLFGSRRKPKVAVNRLRASEAGQPGEEWVSSALEFSFP